MSIPLIITSVYYRIAGKFGGKKVWQIQFSKDLAKESLANGIVN